MPVDKAQEPRVDVLGGPLPSVARSFPLPFAKTNEDGKLFQSKFFLVAITHRFTSLKPLNHIGQLLVSVDFGKGGPALR